MNALVVLAILMLAISVGYSVARAAMLRQLIPTILIVPDEKTSLVFKDDRGKCYEYDVRDVECDV